jgi:hypothetical protein
VEPVEEPPHKDGEEPQQVPGVVHKVQAVLVAQVVLAVPVPAAQVVFYKGVPDQIAQA